MASIRKRGNKYFIDYRENGKRLRKVVGSSLSEAEAALHHIKSQETSSECGVVESFLKATQQTLSKNSYLRYKSICQNFHRFLEHKHLSSDTVTASVLDAYVVFRQNEEIEARTINAELVILCKIFNLKEISKLPITKRKDIRWLSIQESKKLIEFCDVWFYPVLYFLLHTGVRKNELENLTWNDIHLDKKIITIRNGDQRLKNRQKRQIAINDALYEILLPQMYQAREGNYVFPGPDGTKIAPNYLRNQLMALAQKCELKDVTQLDMVRHTFAARLLDRGIDSAVVAELMGDTKANMHAIYKQLMRQRAHKIMEDLDFGA